MGCIVNGPGESKHADIGISLPGTGEAPAAPVFIDGEKAMTLRGEGIAARVPRASSKTTSSGASARDCSALTLPPRRSARRLARPAKRLTDAPMAEPIQAVKGMNDILPPESARWEWFEDKVRALMRALRLPQRAHADRRADARCSCAASAR